MPQWVFGQSFDGLVGLADDLRGCSELSLRSRSCKGRSQLPSGRYRVLPNMKRPASAEKRSLRQLALVLILLASPAALVPLAHASPPDPAWIRGIYDNADYDEVVAAATSTDSTLDLIPPVSPIPIVVRLIRPATPASPTAPSPPAFRNRSPPTP